MTTAHMRKSRPALLTAPGTATDPTLQAAEGSGASPTMRNTQTALPLLPDRALRLLLRAAFVELTT